MNFGDNANNIRPMDQKLNPTSLINSFEDWVTSKRTQNSRIQIWDLNSNCNELYVEILPRDHFSIPTGYPKIGSSPNRPQILSRTTFKMDCMDFEVSARSKSRFNRNYTFFSSNRGKLQWESLYGLGTNPLNLKLPVRPNNTKYFLNYH